MKKNYTCDLFRESRTGVPEVVFARFKDKESLFCCIDNLLKLDGKVLVTKSTKSQISLMKKRYGSRLKKADEISGTVVISDAPGSKIGSDKKKVGEVLVLAAGSADYFVAEECSISLEFFGFCVHRCYDCGIAGLHRLAKPLKILKENNVHVVIVVAGMDGALPSAIAGLIKQPVIAVPTSVGYGTGLKGISALLTMLNSCSPGISVVNIDNGFGAAVCALKIVKSFR